MGTPLGANPQLGWGSAEPHDAPHPCRGGDFSPRGKKNPKQTVLQMVLQSAVGSARVTHALGASIDLFIPKHHGGQKSQIFTVGTNGSVGSFLHPPILSSQCGVKRQMGSWAPRPQQRDARCQQKVKLGGSRAPPQSQLLGAVCQGCWRALQQQADKSYRNRPAFIL